MKLSTPRLSGLTSSDKLPSRDELVRILGEDMRGLTKTERAAYLSNWITEDFVPAAEEWAADQLPSVLSVCRELGCIPMPTALVDLLAHVALSSVQIGSPINCGPVFYSKVVEAVSTGASVAHLAVFIESGMKLISQRNTIIWAVRILMILGLAGAVLGIFLSACWLILLPVLGGAYVSLNARQTRCNCQAYSLLIAFAVVVSELEKFAPGTCEALIRQRNREWMNVALRYGRAGGARE